MPCSQDITSAEKEQNVLLSVYHAETVLEQEIQAILQDPSLRKSEKRKRLRFLKENSSSPRSQNHIQYYLDLLQKPVQSVFWNILSIVTVALFFLYALSRLIQNF